ncbi:MAG TPA: PQQ-dependent sugar dehydrogenase [Saprospiraceae bacterium]|nr:PQQ-dependent sugar dehydrogenase [Saprospiraceae bacterium]HNT20326.1 PQQ-dependent sugar dehydrogenase [Saprospiraceae bacterium]
MIKASLSSCLLAAVFFLAIHACKSGSGIDTRGIARDPESINQGMAIFNMQCSPCHSFRQDGIGPQLGGLTLERETEWIKKFILNPAALFASGDVTAKQLVEKYKVIMPAFALKPEELDDLLAFMHTHPKPSFADTSGLVALENPIPDTIRHSDLVVDLELVTRFPASSDSGKLPLTRITKMDPHPNTGESYVLDLRGKLYRLEKNKPVVYMDMAKFRPKFINQPGLATGFGSFAFHPEFHHNGLLYTTHTEPPGTATADFAFPDSIRVLLQWVLMEWKTPAPGEKEFRGSGRELFRVNMESGIHGVQEIIFNPLSKPGYEDYGMLYIGIGDGGAVEHGYPFIAHNLKTVWGNILRIDPAGNNSRNGKYGIPASNPFAKNPDALGEIFATGFRNPHRITWSRTGQMLVSNVGHYNIESLNLVEAGLDFGWPLTEGRFLVNAYADLKKVYALPPDHGMPLTYPVVAYDHDEGKAITGGYEYTGEAVPPLKGKFLFGDIPTGRLFYVNMADIQSGSEATIKEWSVAHQGKVQSLRELCGTDRVDLHFGRDAAGEIYIMTKPDGKLYKLVKAEEIN